jgi:Holliday junction DNA helicase RuvB
MDLWNTIYEATGISYVMEMLRGESVSSKEDNLTINEIKPMRYDFRPENLDQYIGQEEAKDRIKMCVEQCLTLNPVHFLIYGTKGHGKTTLALIIAKMLGFEIMTYVGNSFTQKNLIDFLSKNQDNSAKGMVLFIDEIHGLDKNLADYMLPIIEQFILPEGKLKLRPFVLIGCTTDKNQLAKKSEPFVDRCASGDIKLEHYKAENIKVILKQLNDRVYQVNIPEEVYDILAINTRFNPRTAIAFFKDYLICKDINKVLKSHRVVKNSLNTDDILVLKHLVEIGKPIGMEVLAIITQQTKQDYQLLQEPFLIQQGYVSRTARGRVATEKTKLLLQNLKNEN